jgi:hypothetical protein
MSFFCSACVPTRAEALLIPVLDLVSRLVGFDLFIVQRLCRVARLPVGLVASDGVPTMTSKDQAARLFALAVLAADRGDIQGVEELTKLAMRYLDQDLDQAIAETPTPSPSSGEPAPAQQQQQSQPPKKDE